MQVLLGPGEDISMKNINIFILSIITSFVCSGFAETDLLSQQLQKNGKADVLVFLKAKASFSAAEKISNRNTRVAFVRNQLVKVAQDSQANLISFLKKNNFEYQSFYIENAILVKNVNASDVSKLSRLNDVEFLRLDGKSEMPTFPIVSQKGVKLAGTTPDSITDLGIDRVWKELGITGKGIVIGGADSGVVWNHNALKPNYRGNSNGKIDHNYNWHDAIAKSNTPIDETGHGTHTIGTAVGDDGAKAKIGAAPGAKWIGCRNMNKKNVGSVSSYLECMEFMLAPYPLGGNPKTDGKPELAPHIINNSWSCPVSEGCKGDELIGAIRAFKAAGIFVVAAAGNDGSLGCSTIKKAPGFYAGELFTVGSYNRRGSQVAFFSSQGPSTWNNKISPNLIAYGDIILSADLGGPNSYMERMGTSMASPQVAGVVALLWSAKPELIGQIDKTTEILEKTAKPIFSDQTCGGVAGSLTPNNSAGNGILDAFAVLTYKQ